MDKKRDKLEIIRDILSSIKDKKQIKPTRLLHSSNLSPQMFKEYVSLLLQRGLIEEAIIKNKKFFILKNKGQEFLIEYRAIEETIKNFGL
jgi:predicted transcriptional regulator